MEIDIDYYYRFTYVPFRCQNPRDGIGFARTSVEIAELSDEEAPVVMAVSNPPMSSGESAVGKGYDRFLAKDGRPRRVRMRDGYFYVESVSRQELFDQAGNTDSLNRTFLASGVGGDRKPGREPHERRDDMITSYTSIIRREGGMRAELTRDDRGAKAAEQLAIQASRVFCVDGVTYELCREPVFVMNLREGYENAIGIVESYPNLKARLDECKYNGRFDVTVSMAQAAHALEAYGKDASRFEIQIMDPTASCYDGVAMDMSYALLRAQEDLRKTLHATSVGVVQAYHRITEALTGLDMASPSVSDEMIRAAEGVVAIGSDPDIEEPMEQLYKARYMNHHSRTYRPSVNLDEGTDFGIGLHHVSEYRDRYDLGGKALENAQHALNRWHLKHPDASFDNGQSTRMATDSVFDGLGKVVVNEIGSVAQARDLARDLGVPFEDVENAVSTGRRLYRISGWAVAEGGSAAAKGAVALVAGPGANGDGEWDVHTSGHPAADVALDAVFRHIEATSVIDATLAADDQVISIF